MFLNTQITFSDLAVLMLTKRTISTTVSEQVIVHGEYNLKNLKPTKWMHKRIHEIKNKLDEKKISALITLSQGH